MKKNSTYIFYVNLIYLGKKIPLRESPLNRDFLFDKFKEKLSSRKKKYYEVYGRLDNRLAFCLDIISKK